MSAATSCWEVSNPSGMSDNTFDCFILHQSCDRMRLQRIGWGLGLHHNEDAILFSLYQEDTMQIIERIPEIRNNISQVSDNDHSIPCNATT